LIRLVPCTHRWAVYVSQLPCIGFKRAWPCWPVWGSPVHSQSEYYDMEQLSVRCARVSEDLDTRRENKGTFASRVEGLCRRYSHPGLPRAEVPVPFIPLGCLEWRLMGQSHLSLHCTPDPSVTNRSCQNLEFFPVWDLGWQSWSTEMMMVVVMVGFSLMTLCLVRSIGQHFSLGDPRCLPVRSGRPKETPQGGCGAPHTSCEGTQVVFPLWLFGNITQLYTVACLLTNYEKGLGKRSQISTCTVIFLVV